MSAVSLQVVQTGHVEDRAYESGVMLLPAPATDEDIRKALWDSWNLDEWTDEFCDEEGSPDPPKTLEALIEYLDNNGIWVYVEEEPREVIVDG